MTFNSLLNLILEADSWISGFIFPDLTVIYSKSNWEHHGDLILKHEQIFMRYFDSDYIIEDVEEAFMSSKIYLFKNRNIVPFIIEQGRRISYDVPPSPEQKEQLERMKNKIVTNYGASQGVA